MRVIGLVFIAALAAYAQSAGSDGLIRFYQDHVMRDDTDYANYDRLGSAYLQKARESGDPVYYDLAEKAFRQALAVIGGPVQDSAGVTAHLAVLDLAEHRFAEAHALAEKALQLKPELISVYAVLGDAALESGDYGEAQRDFGHLILPEDALPPRPGIHYLADTREAGLEFVKGDAEAAIRHTLAAIAEASEAGLPQENVAWSQFSLGELYFAIGDYAHAEAAYLAALDTYPNYHRALAWLGQLRAAQGRYGEAADLYRRAIAIIPLPVYAAALGDIEERMGQAGDAKKQYGLVELIAKLSALNQNLFRRELAIFYADHNVRLGEALALAREELAARKDVYTWDAFAWVSLQNGDTVEAADAISHALAQGSEEPLFLFHAGMIFDRLGDAGRARQYFERALALNPHFHIVYADLARQILDKPEVASVR
jgi:tetratricopeptide (TPR) repeat protein